MRLLQLGIGPQEMLDLHPNVTVVQGLDDGGRRTLVDAVAGLARAEGAPTGGLLEAHGVLFDLTSELLGLLDLDSVDIDPIVRPGDLPAQPLTVDARELRAREEEFAALLARIAAQAERQSHARSALTAATAAVDAARRARLDADTDHERRAAAHDDVTRRLQAVVEERDGLERELAELRPARDAAASRLAEAEAAAAPLSEATAASAARRDQLAVERDALAADLDVGAAAAMEAAQERLGAVMTAVAAERAAPHADAGADSPEAARLHEPLSARIERIEARVEELNRLLVALAPLDTSEVAEALALLRGGDSMEQVPSVEALALADEIDAIGLELGDDDDAAASADSLTAARERLEDARQALLEAEHAMRTPILDRDDVIRLEDAHAALLDAIDKADSRFGGSRARTRVDELRAAEVEILDVLGFASYSDYMMGNSLANVDPVKEAALDAARTELTATEDEHRRIERLTDAALARAAVLDRRRGLLKRARELLGAPVPAGEVHGALLSLRVPVVSAEDSANRLQQCLTALGLELADEDLDHIELGFIAEAWLEEAATAAERWRDAQTERDHLQDELAQLRSVPEDPASAEGAVDEPEVAAPDPEEERSARVAAARAGLEDAEHRWLAHEVAHERLAVLAAELADATALADSARAAAADTEAAVAEAAAELAAVEVTVGPRERALVQATDAQAQLREALAAIEAAPPPDLVALDAALARCEAEHRLAVDDLETEDRALAALDAEGQAAALEIERLQEIVAAQGSGTVTEAEELEWYLLARLAAQRSVSVAGSLPLLLDDALRGLHGREIEHLLGRLERMGEAVQVIVVSEDPVVADWAREAGPAHAAVVRPGPP